MAAENPDDWVFSQAHYVMGEDYRRRLEEYTEMMANLLGAKTRTCRSYAMYMTMVHHLRDCFPEEFQAKGLTQESWNK